MQAAALRRAQGLTGSGPAPAAMAAARIAGSARHPGAWANGAEHTRGVITRGHDAELVVLTRDPSH